MTMRRLRQKVELDPNRPVHLLTVRGIGYRLVGASVGGSMTDAGEGTVDGGDAPAAAGKAARALIPPRNASDLPNGCHGPRRRATPSTASHRAIRSTRSPTPR